MNTNSSFIFHALSVSWYEDDHHNENVKDILLIGNLYRAHPSLIPYIMVRDDI